MTTAGCSVSGQCRMASTGIFAFSQSFRYPRFISSPSRWSPPPRPIAQNSDSESFGGLLLFRLHFSDDGFRARPPRVHVHSASGKTLQHPQHFGRKFLKSSHAMTAALCGDVTNVPDAK